MRVRLFVASTFIIIVLSTAFVSGQPQSVAARSSLPASGTNVVVDSAPFLAPSGASTVFLPFVAVTRDAVDFTIAGLEVTQSVQDTSNTVPLVAGRQTVVRVYAQSNQSYPGSVYVDLAGTRGGAPLPGSPLRLGPLQVSTAPSRGIYSSSFNFLLPSSWDSGNVAFTARVDSTNLVSETNENNNTASAALAFNAMPTLNLKIVPINYTHTPTGAFYPGPTTDTISDWIMRSYPLSAVNVSLRAPLAFSGDLTVDSGWINLLYALTDAKTADGAPASQDYVGLIPFSYPNGWGTPANGGIGWIGEREAVILNYPVPPYSADATGELGAHEVGHNFGLYHAPCGNPANPDPNYPYPGASIGQYGLDVTHSRVWSPVSPDFAVDVMSYCSPVWWSDYNYKKLYNDQIVHGLAPVRQPAAQPSLMIRARFDDRDAPELSPVYSLMAVPTAAPANSEYAIQLIDQSGAVVASYPAVIREAQEQNLRARSISAIVPRPTQPVASVRLVRAGAAVVERSLVTTRQPVAAPTVEQATGALTIRWGAQSAALVRYVPDDGSAPITIGVDVLGGALRVDPQTLPGGTGHFEVVLADGATLETPRAPSTSMMLPASTPVAWITGPTSIKAGAPLILFGHGANLEEGALSDLRWSVDGNDVATGTRLQVERLAAGSHTVTLTVRDAKGTTAQATYSVTVVP